MIVDFSYESIFFGGGGGGGGGGGWCVVCEAVVHGAVVICFEKCAQAMINMRKSQLVFVSN